MFYFFTLIFLFYAPLANANVNEDDWPYQNCNPQNIEYTQNIIDELSNENTEAKAPCVECSDNNYLEAQQKEVEDLKKPFKPVIHKECFLAMAIRGNRLFENKRYKYCENKESKKLSARKKLCINKSYIDMIQKSFNYMSQCFNLDTDKQEEMLALINQESGGILNVQSRTGARCLGQVTKDYVKTINKSIKSGKSDIYNKTLKRCPEVEKFQISNKKVTQENSSLTCRVTRDPYSCLFYTFFGLEKSHQQIKEKLNSSGGYMGNREFSRKDKKQFNLPIKTNEMLNVTIKFKGGNKAKTYTFWDDSELFGFMKNIRANRTIETLKAQKTPLFKENKNIETMFYYWSHNGGNSYARWRMVGMVERLKQSIARSCKANDSSERCKLRKQIQNGEALSAQQVLPIFEKDLQKTYPSKKRSRRNEVAEYVGKIKDTNRFIFSYSEESGATNRMINDYKKAVKFDGKTLSDEQAMNFQKQVAKKCRPFEF